MLNCYVIFQVLCFPYLPEAVVHPALLPTYSRAMHKVILEGKRPLYLICSYPVVSDYGFLTRNKGRGREKYECPNPLTTFWVTFSLRIL